MLTRIVWLFLAAFPVWAGDVHVDVRFTPSSPSLSDVIRMEVTLTGTEGSNVVLKPVDIPPDCVRVQSSIDGGTRAIVMLDPVKPGPCRIPAFRTRCLHGATEGCDASSAETVIAIGTVVANPDNADIRDKEETPVDFRDDNAPNGESVAYVPWLAGFGFVIACCAAYRAWRIGRNNPVRQAERRLRELAVTDSNPSEAFAQLIVIFRDYLDQRLGFNARSCTSPELMDALRRRSIGQGSTSNDLRDFLAACDRAKFSGVADVAAEFDGAAEECRTLIQSLEFYIARSSRDGI